MSLRDLVLTPTLFHGVAIAAAIGLLGGFAMKVGSQSEAKLNGGKVQGSQYKEAAPIAWPDGKTPDYVIGTDFLTRPAANTPAEYVVADEPAPYQPAAWRAPPPPPTPVRTPRAPDPAGVERRWASTGGDILDMRLPEDIDDAPDDMADDPAFELDDLPEDPD